MSITFKKLGIHLDQLSEMEKLGLRYKKYQKKQLLAVSKLSLPSEAALSELQNEIGRLPPDYLEFLRAVNGGVPSKSVFPTADGRLVVSALYAAGGMTLLPETIEYQRNLMKGRIPSEMLAIGESPGGDRFLLNTSSPFGQILYWRHEKAGPEAVLPLTDSFTTFISGLMSS